VNFFPFSPPLQKEERPPDGVVEGKDCCSGPVLPLFFFFPSAPPGLFRGAQDLDLF